MGNIVQYQSVLTFEKKYTNGICTYVCFQILTNILKVFKLGFETCSLFLHADITFFSV